MHPLPEMPWRRHDRLVGRARNAAEQPDQGWTLLCNGVVVFDDLGALLPDGRVATIPDTPAVRLLSAA